MMMLTRTRGLRSWGVGLRRTFSNSAPALDESEETLQRQALAKRAHREVQVARRRRREAEDEVVMFQSAKAAGFGMSSTDDGDELQRRRRSIDKYLTARAEAIMDVLAAQRPLREAVDFVLEVAPSLDLPQPIAGDGVFVKEGEVPAGTLIAFYPGSVYMPHEVRWLGGYGPTLDRAGQHTSSHVIGRVGGVRIDGLWSTIEVPSSEYALDDSAINTAIDALELEHDSVGGQAARADAEAFRAGLTDMRRSCSATVPYPDHRGNPEQIRAINPLAVGEMINHPPNGAAANVLGWPIDLNLFGEGDERASYARVAPNSYALRPEGAAAPGSPCPYTVCLVTAQTLKPGDELYLDYGCELLPVEDIPLWFTPASLRGVHDDLQDPVKNPSIAIRDELHAWRDNFEVTHGRKATRIELMTDPIASALFETFQSYRKLGDL